MNFKRLLSLFLFVVMSLIYSACGEDSNAPTKKIKGIAGMDLPAVLKNGKLRVLIENASSSYFIYKGKKMGFEYELLKEFTQDLGIDLELITIQNLDDVDQMLNRGEADIIACNYTVTNERKKDVAFSKPFLLTSQVLVQRKPDGWEKMSDSEIKAKLLTDPTQLANKKVNVWKNSSYYRRLVHLQEEIGDSILIQEETGSVATEDLIEKVSEGMIEYTVVEKNVAQINTKFFDNLDVDLEISFKQKIAFALRKSSPLLRVRLDEWLAKYTQSTKYTYLKKKYFELSQVSIHDEYSSMGGGQLSKYDKLFKKEAAKYDWDWRLLASLAYQESKFNPTVVSFGGAYGMMQFMPGTGPRYGVYPTSPVEVQIAGGMKKLHADYQSWPEVKNKDQRYKFALASYNAGLGHIKDAQRLAKKRGLNPTVWDGHVAEMVKNLSHSEYYRDEVVEHGAMRGAHTANYVSTIFSRYQTYKSTFR